MCRQGGIFFGGGQVFQKIFLGDTKIWWGIPPVGKTLTYGNGNYLSRQAQKLLETKGINASVVDLRYLAPLDEAGILAQVQSAKCTLIVDECRETGSISEALFTLIAESGVEMNQVARICAQDSFIPLGSAAYHVLPSKEDIVEQAIALIERVS